MTLTVYRGACEIKRDCINISRLEMHKKENNPFWRKTQENLNHPASFPGEEPVNEVFWYSLICQSFQAGENMWKVEGLLIFS